MVGFKGTATDLTEGSGLDWRLMDHRNIQDLGKRPFTTMLQPAHHQRRKTEDARRPSLQFRSRSNSSAPNYSRPHDTDDLSPVATPIDRRTTRNSGGRRPISAASTHARTDSLDSFTPKAWMAKGSRFLKRQNSKQELTSLRTLDWLAEEEARVQRILDQAPPASRHSRSPSTSGANAAARLNISEPFNFHHVTHTQPHHVQQLERADPNDLVSEFFALRASQASQPELRGIKAQDIHREDLPQDALLPESPSMSRDGPASLARFRTSRIEDHAKDSLYIATSPTRTLERRGSSNNFSQPSAGYHAAQTSPKSSPPPIPCRHLTPDLFTFHDENPSEPTFDPPIPTDSPEALDYPIGTWSNGVYDFASPHAVTTDDGANWIQQVPFSMVKTELAPVEEDDETDEKRNSILASIQRPVTPNSGICNTKSFPTAEVSLHRDSDACMPAAEDIQSGWSHPTTLAERIPYGRFIGPLSMPSAKNSEVPVEDPLDDIPVRPRFSRHTSVGLHDMDGFWDIASDAINCSYALGAEGDSNFDWHRSSIPEDDMSVPIPDHTQTDAADTESERLKRNLQLASLSPSTYTAKRSSSVYSSSPPSILPLQTFPSKLDPPSATSTESSFSSIPEAVTPNETTQSTMSTGFSAVNCKEWYQPAHIVPNDFEPQTVDEDFPYSSMYASDYPQDAPFLLHNAGRIDGSTISNSPRSSRSPISKSSSQESFWYLQAASTARRPRNPGSAGSLPELMSCKNSRERIDPAVDQSSDNMTFLVQSDSLSDSQQTATAQRRRSPNLAKDAAQNIMLSKVRTVEESVPLLSAPRGRAMSDLAFPVPGSFIPPPPQAVAGRRMRSGSSTSSLNAKSSQGIYSILPAPHTTPVHGR